MKLTFTSKFPFIKRTNKQNTVPRLTGEKVTAIQRELTKSRTEALTYGEHMRSNPPIPEAELRDVIPLSGTTKGGGGNAGTTSGTKIGEGEPWFDPRATLAMNEQNRQYYEAAKTLTAKSDKVKLALKVYGFGSAAFFGRKTGLSTKEAGSVLSELKKKGIVEVKEKCACEDGHMVNSYALANKE